MRIAFAAAAVSFMLASGSAFAQQGWYGGDSFGSLPPYQISALVRAAGLRPVTQPVQRGDRYYVYATDRSGQLRRVTLDADFGDIQSITAVAQPRLAERDDRWGPPRRWWGDEDEIAVVRPPAPIRRWRDLDAPRPYANAPGQYDRDEDARPTPPKPSVRARVKPEAPHTAAINPTQPAAPTPRARPASKPASASPPQAKATPEHAPDAAPSVAAKPPASTARPEKPAAKPETPAQATAPRVILPGGPQPKAERSAEAATRSLDRAPANDAPKAKAEPQSNAASPLPPVQPLE